MKFNLILCFFYPNLKSLSPFYLCRRKTSDAPQLVSYSRVKRHCLHRQSRWKKCFQTQVLPTLRHKRASSFLQCDTSESASLSMNILCIGNKLPVQKCFFKNRVGDSLSALRFLGGLYNFCNFVIIFSLM